MFTHAFVRHDIELAASIYFFAVFCLHLSAFFTHTFAKRFDSTHLHVLCLVVFDFTIAGCVVFVITISVFTHVAEMMMHANLFADSCYYYSL